MTAPDVPILPPMEAPETGVESEKPCCTRIVNEFSTGWCILPTGHPPPCQCVPPRYTCEGPPADRKIKSAFNSDMALKWHHLTVMRVRWLIKWDLPVDILGEF